ncbi:MAG: fatty acid CoA ligase family protein [Desulfocapsaceae bacterium]|nr:fatty acid CoA ligase family protein [Desulfocapsaceae bacterium]
MTLNIAETLVEAASKYSDKVGLIEAKTGKSLTFSQLQHYSDQLAVYLSDKGVRRGDRVMLMVTPSADFICLTFALFKIGAPVILIDPGMGYRNLLRCIAGVRPEIFIGVPKAHLFRKVYPKPFSTIRHAFCCGASWGLFGADIRQASQHCAGNFQIHRPAADDLAAIIFTTGSTGPPKGVRYEHSIFATQLGLIKDYYGISPADVDQPAFPLFALFSTALGACSVIPDMNPAQPAQVDPVKFLNSINRHKVTYSFGSPAIWDVVSRYCIEKGITITSLRQVLMAGAPVSGELIQRMQAILPSGARIHTPYGATESLPIVSMEGREILESTWKVTRAGGGTCVGRALPGIRIMIIAISDEVIAELDDACPLPVGTIGEIIVSGGVVTRSYDNNEAETQFSKIRDGEKFWHRMGDTGYLDGEGRLWFCGRRAHRVRTNKQDLFTIPCEAIINVHPQVRRTALVGIPDINNPGLQEPVLIIEKKKNIRVDDLLLLQEIRKLAAGSRLTGDIKHFLFHHDFPVDIRHNAKIFREKLSLWAELELKKR